MDNNKLNAKVKSVLERANALASIYEDYQNFIKDKYKIPAGKLQTEKNPSRKIILPQDKPTTPSVFVEQRKKFLADKYGIDIDSGLKWEGQLGARMQAAAPKESVTKFESKASTCGLWLEVKL
jgi:hypothetical protein